jgi:hypothetical protein
VTILTASSWSCSSLPASATVQLSKASHEYSIVKGDTPEYLSDLLPRTVNQANNYNLPNASNFTIPRCRLTLYQNSFFPVLIHLWNILRRQTYLSCQNCDDSNSFKLKLLESASIGNCTTVPSFTIIFKKWPNEGHVNTRGNTRYFSMLPLEVVTFL